MKMDEDGTPNENTVAEVKNFINCNFTNPKLMWVGNFFSNILIIKISDEDINLGKLGLIWSQWFFLGLLYLYNSMQILNN